MRWSRKPTETPELERTGEADAGAAAVLNGEEPAYVAHGSDERDLEATTEVIRAAEEAVQKLVGEAQRVRAEADEYMANVRLAADSYAAQRQADAEEQSRKMLEEADVQARRLLEPEPEVPEIVATVEEEARPDSAVRVRRGIELTAVAAVMSRDISVFLRSWRSTTFSAIVEPIIFLLAFGLGFGALIARVDGVEYIQFVATGVVATTVVFSSAFPAMFSTFVKREFQRIYDALLATPVNVNELVTAEVLWISIRTGIYSIAPVLVAIGFGLRPGWGVVLVPFIAFLAALGLSSFGVTMAAMMKTIANFNYIISGVLTPLILLAGAYFPVDELPRWAFYLNQLNPLYHCVTLVRDAVFGFNTGDDLYHVGALVLFALLMWRIAIWKLRPRLVD